MNIKYIKKMDNPQETKIKSSFLIGSSETIRYAPLLRMKI